ncbi:hypothetical protein [Thalassospira xiamenensis]|uniref:Uncharacterized protein n=1 Tax=Thalassospira xiamenensis TaxID=220697 RepID=A0A285TGV9_9PROT|nr:hypothetical protein [Thalassospira xiamenensis]SOC21379.1 hypothetical protein SAMN05428964_103389 [Thalassospira xiamenensis]
MNIPALPPKMMHMKRDKRGFPIPFVQFIVPETGEPDFRVVDQSKAAKAIAQRLCAICGKKMGAHVFFIGGPKCVENGYFIDGPVHLECGQFALRTCPHLARSKGRYSQASKPDTAEQLIVDLDVVDPNKVTTFALMKSTKYHCETMDGYPVIKAKMPWKAVQWWRDGKPLRKDELAVTDMD